MLLAAPAERLSMLKGLVVHVVLDKPAWRLTQWRSLVREAWKSHDPHVP